jgi:hypothetical protein
MMDLLIYILEHHMCWLSIELAFGNRSSENALACSLFIIGLIEQWEFGFKFLLYGVTTLPLIDHLS